MKYASLYDNKGKLYVDCTECNRGINGHDIDKCCAGFKIKKKNLGGCFLGKLIDGIDRSQLKRLDSRQEKKV